MKAVGGPAILVEGFPRSHLRLSLPLYDTVMVTNTKGIAICGAVALVFLGVAVLATPVAPALRDHRVDL